VMESFHFDTATFVQVPSPASQPLAGRHAYDPFRL
jgi:hypothetical protein